MIEPFLLSGAKSQLTIAAQNMLKVCIDLLAQNEDKLMKLEKMINPLLDDDDQVALSFIFTNIVNKIKTMQESWAFVKPVNRKMVKDYYDIVEHPMDLETISNNVKGTKLSPLTRDMVREKFHILILNVLQLTNTIRAVNFWTIFN
mgnify:CR=1 FL=1